MLIQKIKGVSVVFFICIVFSLIAGNLPNNFIGENTSSQNIRYILDAGHGIPDGGAVASDGTTEQELNLAITLKLSEKLNQYKITHILTRSDENSIYTEGQTIHAKKVSDVRERIKIADETPDIPLISIHMNSYPSGSVHGIQVFCSDHSEDTKKLASTLQSAFNTTLQPENTKALKSISKNIYLFSHIKNPSILIECGFLSNEEELNQLKSPEYQDQLVQIIGDVLRSSC